MIQVTLTFNSIAAAVAALAKIPEADAAFAKTTPVNTGVTANEKAAVLQANETAMADTVDPTPAPKAEAPGKPAAKAVATPSTATPAAASTEKSEPASPTTQPAAAPAAEGEFKYETLQRAVNAAVPKHGKDKLLAIAKAHGADNFKGLPADKWAAAHADVLALGV